MGFLVNDRVKETTTTVGTGTVTLAGAVHDFESFEAGIGDGNVTYYCIFHESDSYDEWEVGVGTYTSSGTTLSRTAITSSNSDSLVSFTAGTKSVFVTMPASKGVFKDNSGAFVTGDGSATGFMTSLVDDTSPQLGGDLDLNSKNLDFPTVTNISDCLDEDDMSSDSATKLATQQSIKAYADTKLAAVVDDTSPQLGGDLDLNSKNLDFPTTSNISDCLDEDAMGSNSATALATQQSIKAYADSVGATFPTFTSVAPSVATNDLTSLVITGTNFGGSGIPAVEFQASTGVITAASSVVRDSTTQITAGCTLPVDGTYFVRVELNSGLAVRSTTAVLTISDEPVWTTASGDLGTIAGNFSGTVTTVAATGDTVAYTETTDVLENASLANCSLNSSTGVISTTDFGGADTAATLFTFTLRVTDAQGQTTDREFTLTSSYGATGGGQFN